MVRGRGSEDIVHFGDHATARQADPIPFRRRTLASRVECPPVVGSLRLVRVRAVQEATGLLHLGDLCPAPPALLGYGDLPPRFQRSGGEGEFGGIRRVRLDTLPEPGQEGAS